MIGLISRIERGAVHDGPGLRTVVFLKGCPLRCLWCHSPETQSRAQEVLLLRERCIGCGNCVVSCQHAAATLVNGVATADRSRCSVCGACAEVCPTGARVLCGHRLGIDEIMRDVLRDRMFFDQSGGGVTVSGGEPLMQAAFTLALLERCRSEDVHTAVETCGLVNETTLLAAADYTDLFLFDVKMIDDRRHRALTGASNTRILSNLTKLAAVHPNVIVRYPLVPGLNDDLAALRGLGECAAARGLRRIDVLPYHRAGSAKYQRLDRVYGLTSLEPPDPGRVEEAVETLRACGVDARTGGA